MDDAGFLGSAVSASPGGGWREQTTTSAVFYPFRLRYRGVGLAKVPFAALFAAKDDDDDGGA